MEPSRFLVAEELAVSRTWDPRNDVPIQWEENTLSGKKIQARRLLPSPVFRQEDVEILFHFLQNQARQLLKWSC